jgi:hypothetical protein
LNIVGLCTAFAADGLSLFRVFGVTLQVKQQALGLLLLERNGCIELLERLAS